jgi:hypothetical protein
MLPEKRRRGRAIRKARREARDRLAGYAAFAAWWSEEAPLAIERMAQAFKDLAAALAASGWQPRSLPLGRGALYGKRPGTSDPSQTGVDSARSTHSAFQGTSPGRTIYDEPWSFGEEYGDDAEEDQSDRPAATP